MNTLFQQLPSVDKLLKTKQGVQLCEQFGHNAVVKTIRQLLHQARQQIQQYQQLPEYFKDIENTFVQLQQQLIQQSQVKIQSVHNLTGTVLHTNLGRALWAENAQQAALVAMRQNVALEYDLNQGRRSHRDHYISELIAELTDAEAACVVNNNAAAVLLILSSLASGKEVIISRGELIEIGGAFRIPDIMQQAGCKLVEVGTTNRTHLRDYQNAVNENTAFLMKVHTSNYQICGFTAAVDEQQLVELAKQFNLPVISDLGSGALVDLSQYGLPQEPTIQQKIAQGLDLVCFSGDKLLGGVQAGIIAGKKHLIEKLQTHPLKRALRCDKVILAGLEATLRLYLQPEKLIQQLPTLRLLTQSIEQLIVQAKQVKTFLEQRLEEDFVIQIEPSFAQIGSGAQPTAKLDSIAVTLAEKNAKKTQKLAALLVRFKQMPIPIVSRVEQGKIWLDLRSVANLDLLLESLKQL